MKVYQIKHYSTGDVLFELKCKSMKECVETAIRAKTNLSGANLYEANLYEANLYGANLSGANLSMANLYRANLYEANLSGADLFAANLSGTNLYEANLYRTNLYAANLYRTNLSGANLYEANLSGADHQKTTIQKTPIQLTGLKWPILIFDNDMAIGCEYRSLTDWWSFNDDQISEMDSNALDFWKQHKPILQNICLNTGRSSDKEGI